MIKARKQQRFVSRHLIPLISRFKWQPPIYDLGSGQGEIIITLQEVTGVRCVGIESNRESVINSRRRGAFVVLGDFCTSTISEPAGLVLMCDVVEHVGERAFIAAGKHLNNGLLYICFPPWRSPFGGHQHLSRHWTRYVPWIHLLFPQYLLRIGMNRALRNPDDITSVHNVKLTSARVDALDGWETVYKRKYFIRPNTGVGIPAPCWMPDCFTMGVEYILKEVK